jgi:hypothetical protein
MIKRIESFEIISYLESFSLISSIKVLALDEILARSVLRIRCSLLPSTHHLDIRLIQTENEIIYAYQLFTDHPIVRWDNAPHFPELSTFPHHYHNSKGKVEASRLKGAIFEDLNYVINKIKKMLISDEI